MDPRNPADDRDLTALLPTAPRPGALPHHDAHRAGLLAVLAAEQPAAGSADRGRAGARRLLVPVAAAAAVTAVVVAGVVLPRLLGPSAGSGLHSVPRRSPPAAGSGALRSARQWQVSTAGLDTVVVRTSAGSVSIAGDIVSGELVGTSPGPAPGTVKITARPAYRGTPPVVSTTVRGGLLTITARCLRGGGSDCQVSLNLRLPRGMGVQASTGLGRIAVLGMTGPVTVSDALGNVQLQDVAGPLTVTDSLGDIDGFGLTSEHSTFTADLGAIDVAFSSPPARVAATDQEGNVTVRVPATVDYQVAESAQLGSATCTVPRSVPSAHMITASSQLGSVTVTS
jgi:hypothetical protein